MLLKIWSPGQHHQGTHKILDTTTHLMNYDLWGWRKNFCFFKATRWFWFMLKFVNLWCKNFLYFLPNLVYMSISSARTKNVSVLIALCSILHENASASANSNQCFPQLTQSGCEENDTAIQIVFSTHQASWLLISPIKLFSQWYRTFTTTQIPLPPFQQNFSPTTYLRLQDYQETTYIINPVL